MPLHSKLLKFIEEVSKTGSIRSAARNLHVSSTTINKRIISLEHELGIHLFKRNPKGVELTKAGRIISEHASKTLLEAKDILDKIDGFKEVSSTNIKVAGVVSIINVLSPLIHEYHLKYENTYISFNAQDADEVVNLVKAEKVDLAIIFDINVRPDVKVIIEKPLPVYAIATKDHPLANLKEVTINDCCQYPLVLPDSSWNLRGKLNKEFNEIGVTPNIILSSNLVDTMVAMVKNNDGICITSKMGIEFYRENNEIICIPFAKGHQIYTTLSVIVRKNFVMDDELILLFDKFKHKLDRYN